MEGVTDSNPSKGTWLERWFLLKAGVLAGILGGGLPGALLGSLTGWLWVESSAVGQGLFLGLKYGFIVGAGLGILVGAAWGLRMRMNPLTARKVQRFRTIRRGFWSYMLLMAAFVISIFGEAVVGNRALIVKYDGGLDFPFLPFLSIRTGQDWGLEKDWKGNAYNFEVNYLELQEHFEQEGKGNWVLMPLVPFWPDKMQDMPYQGQFVRVTMLGESRQLGLDFFEVMENNTTFGRDGEVSLSSSAEANASQPRYLTQRGADPWVELDLGALRRVETVRLFFPAEEHEALRGEWRRYRVELMDADRQAVWIHEVAQEMPPAAASKRIELIPKPGPPDFARGHYLGTDSKGYDIFAKVFYGFRIAMIFALGFVLMVYLIGVIAGCLMGYFGGWVDLIGQRGVEIWQNIPYLYMVIIVAATIQDLPISNIPSWFRIAALLGVMVFFSWTSMTYYMRTAVYREKARDYVAAAQLLGASTPRVLFNHLMPNTISTMVTFMPFTVATAIISVTALDYLGLGLPIGTPSWGAVLKDGVGKATQAPWIVLSAFCAMVSVLTLVTFIGEAVREAFDPKKFTTYE